MNKTRRDDHVRIVWSIPGRDHGVLRCPRCPDLDVTVHTPADGARAVGGHLELHATTDAMEADR